MKVYVDSQEDGFIYDSFLADNTILISEFHLEESQLEYTECKLLDLSEYNKQVRKEVIKEIKETMNKFGKKYIYNNNGDVIGVFEALSLNEIINILDQIQGVDNGN